MSPVPGGHRPGVRLPEHRIHCGHGYEGYKNSCGCCGPCVLQEIFNDLQQTSQTFYCWRLERQKRWIDSMGYQTWKFHLNSQWIIGSIKMGLPTESSNFSISVSTSDIIFRVMYLLFVKFVHAHFSFGRQIRPKRQQSLPLGSSEEKWVISVPNLQGLLPTNWWLPKEFGG